MAVGLALGAILMSGAAHASVVKKSIPDLIGDSDVVIQGKVKDIESHWNDSGSIIVTRVTVEVESGVLGDPGGNQVGVIVPGGRVGHIELEVSDTPEFRRGGQAFLFLVAKAGGDWEVAGGYQGKVGIEGGRVPDWDMPAGEFADRVAGGGIGLEKHDAKPEGRGKPGGGGGDKGYKLCGRDWKANGDFDEATGKWSPGGGWVLNNIAAAIWTDAELEGALDRGKDPWNGAGACWEIRAATSIISDPARDGPDFNDGENLVTFGDAGSAVAAVYNWYFRFARKEIVQTDMVFNDVDWTFVINDDCDPDGPDFDFQNIACHEWGHWLCLDDQTGGGDTEKTMYGFVAKGECKKRDLEPSDESGAKAIYGDCP